MKRKDKKPKEREAGRSVREREAPLKAKSNSKGKRKPDKHARKRKRDAPPRSERGTPPRLASVPAAPLSRPPAAPHVPSSRPPAPAQQASLPFDPAIEALDTSYDLTADSEDLEALYAAAPELGGGRAVAPHARFEDALESFHPSTPTGDVEAQIRALEARLDGLIHGVARNSRSEAVREPQLDELELGESKEPVSAETIAVESTAELAGSQYYVQKWGRKGLRSRAEEVDEFGLDRNLDAKLRPLLDFVYRRYFRIQTSGIDHVPSEGRAVVVGNHSGSIPIDGLMLRAAMRLDHPARRELRWLAEDFLFYLPFAGVFMNRAGAVRACQENAERLLSRDNLIAVFPEGVQGIRKLFRDRYRLQRFGRGGYIRLCLRTRAPLIPCAIIGGEEASPLLYRFDALADLLRIPYLPVTPTFPALGALGLLPAPTKWLIKFGEPIAFDNYGPEAADDDLLVGRLSDRVRSTIQSMLDRGLSKRRSVWF